MPPLSQQIAPPQAIHGQAAIPGELLHGGKRRPCDRAFIAVIDMVIAPAAASTMQIPLMQLSLAVAIAVATTVIAAIAFALAAAIAAAIALAFAVTIAAASTDVCAGTRSASPDAWACSNNSSSRRGTLELKAW